MTNRRAGSLVFLIAGIYGLILTLRLPMGRWNEPGAGAFPLIVCILLCLSGLFLFISGKGRAEIDWPSMIKRQWIPFQIVLLTGVFIAALDRLGYLLTASLYLFVLLGWVSRYRIWIALSLAVLLGATSWYLFGKLLATPLPQGLLRL
jgi:hypothetical protein